MNKKIVFLLSLVAALVMIIVVANFYYNKAILQNKPDNLIANESVVSVSSVASETNTNDKREPEVFPAMDFTVNNIDGESVNLSDYFGKPIIVNFWASWCGPCKSEMPEFQKAYDKYGEEIEFLMVNLTVERETRETAMAFVNEDAYTFPVYFDESGAAASTYKIMYIPTTLFIDADGNIAASATAALDEPTLEKGISMIYSAT